MRAVRIILAMLLLIVIGAFAGITLIGAIDLENQRARIAEKFQAATGRSLVIDGRAVADISLHPVISLRNVTVGNAAWSQDPIMARFERLEVQFGLLPMIIGRLAIDRLAVANGRILFEINADGENNWPGLGPGGRPLPPVANLTVEDVTAVYHNLAAGRQSTLTIARAVMGAAQPGATPEVALEATVDDRPLRVTGQVGAPALMTAGTAPVPIDILIEGPGTTLSARGSLPAWQIGEGLDLNVSVDVQEDNFLTTLIDPDLARFVPAKLTARIVGGPGRYTVSNLSAVLPGSEFGGQLVIEPFLPRPRIDGDVRVKTADLDALTEQVKPAGDDRQVGAAPPANLAVLLAVLGGFDGNLSVSAQELGGADLRLRDLVAKVQMSEQAIAFNPFAVTILDLAGFSGGEIGGRVTLTHGQGGARPRLDGSISATNLIPTTLAGDGAGDWIFPDTPLPFGSLAAFDAKLDLDIAALSVAGLEVKAVKGALAINEGRLAMSPLAVDFGRAKLTGRLEAETIGEPPTVLLALSGIGIDLAAVLAGQESSPQLGGQAGVDIELRGHGLSWASIMAELSGHIRFASVDGWADALLFAPDSATGFAAATFFARGAPRARLDCVAGAFAIENGIARVRHLVLDSQFATVVGQGFVNLGAERIDLTLAPRAKGLALAGPDPVRFEGHLRVPDKRSDASAEARAIARELAKLDTAFDVAGDFAALGGRENPCVNPQALARRPQVVVQPPMPAPAPEAKPEAKPAAPEGTGAATEPQRPATSPRPLDPDDSGVSEGIRRLMEE